MFARRAMTLVVDGDHRRTTTSAARSRSTARGSAVLATQGRAPRLLWADESAHLLVTGYVEGELVLGAEAERHLETYAQAGALVARFHGQAARTDADYSEVQRTDAPVA